MKLWINLFFLFCFCGMSAGQAQTINIDRLGIKGRLSVRCFVDGAEVNMSGNAITLSSQQAKAQKAFLKIKLNELTPDQIGSVEIWSNELKKMSDPVAREGIETFPCSIKPGGGRWNFEINANSAKVADYVLTYSVSSLKKDNGNNSGADTDPLIDSEETAWQEIKDANRIEFFKNFLKKYPKSKYYKLAQRKILLLTPFSAKIIDSQENKYTIQVGPVLTPPLSIRANGDTLIANIKKINDKDLVYEVKFELEDSKKYTLKILDPGRAKDGNSFDLTINNTFNSEAIQEEGLPKIKLSGGKPPYTAQFFANNSLVKTLPITQNPWTVSTTAFAKALPPGEYNIKVRDAHMQDTVYIDLDPIVIDEKIGFQWQEWWPYWVAAFFIVTILIVWSSLSNKKKQKRIETAKAQMQQNLEEANPQTEGSTGTEPESISSAITISKETSPVITEPVPVVTEPVLVTESNLVLNSEETPNTNARTGFVIKAKSTGADEQVGDSEYFQNIIVSGKYCSIPLNHIWADSAIKTIFFNPLSVKTLDEFLWAENINLVRTKGANIPEIGGMLLGRCAFDATDKTYVVAIERFVPIQARFHNVYQLAFDPISIATEVSKITDENPDYRIMGWFHTHPGHGLFLSQQDLEIQEHYRELYHFAMEIDSLSDNLDTAFFTRTREGVINNHKNLIKEASWFSWNDIKNHHLSI